MQLTRRYMNFLPAPNPAVRAFPRLRCFPVDSPRRKCSAAHPLPRRAVWRAIMSSAETDVDGKPRCGWVVMSKPHYVTYHDIEWGRPVHDDTVHFELICLEGAQAGLSWELILRKRDAYRNAFKAFNPRECAALSDDYLDRVLRGEEGDVVKNRLKIASVRKNAAVFLAIAAEFGTFDRYVWSFVDHKTIVGGHESYRMMPTRSEESDKLAQDLKQRGMAFIGTTTIYSYLQSAGLVNDHEIGCFCFEDCGGEVHRRKRRRKARS